MADEVKTPDSESATTGKANLQPYEPPKVQAIKLSEEAAEALT